MREVSEYWRLMFHPGLPGTRQMAMDEALFVSARSPSVPVLRFYNWRRPTLSLGYFQDYAKVVLDSFAVRNNIDVVRRITGGRSVLHQYEVTYAVVAPLEKLFAKQSLQETYELIAKALNRGLEKFGIAEASVSLDLPADAVRESRLPQCFVAVSQFEHSVHSRKTIGSAQKRSREAFLQHGSILLDFDLQMQQGCILRPDPQIDRKIAPLNHLLGRVLSFEEVSQMFADAFRETLSVQFLPDDLNADEERLAARLEEKYKSRDWTERRCR